MVMVMVNKFQIENAPHALPPSDFSGILSILPKTSVPYQQTEVSSS